MQGGEAACPRQTWREHKAADLQCCAVFHMRTSYYITPTPEG